MPVTGLPAAVEATLSALLVGNTVSSWKIAGEGENSEVVLRLKPVDTGSNMADTVSKRETPVQRYRRKPPSQTRRTEGKTTEERPATYSDRACC